MFEKIPCLDEKYPQDKWMKKAGKYKYLYEMDTEIAYDWLPVWVDANHPSFQNCIIDRSDNVCDRMNHWARDQPLSQESKSLNAKVS